VASRSFPTTPKRAGVEGWAETAMLESRRFYRGAGPPSTSTDEMMQGVVSLPHGWGAQATFIVGKKVAAGTRPGVSVNDWDGRQRCRSRGRTIDPQRHSPCSSNRRFSAIGRGVEGNPSLEQPSLKRPLWAVSFFGSALRIIGEFRAHLVDQWAKSRLGHSRRFWHVRGLARLGCDLGNAGCRVLPG